MGVGILGGAFDPPHVGHVALARRGVEHFGLDRLLVTVVADPGHKDVSTTMIYTHVMDKGVSRTASPLDDLDAVTDAELLAAVAATRGLAG